MKPRKCLPNIYRFSKSGPGSCLGR
jgi:hypothetical protein